MSTITKNSTSWFLVVISMILLLIFVGYWNVSTYLSEKKKLSEDVEIQLQLALTEIKDSELILFIRTQLTNDHNEDYINDSISIFFDEHPLFSTNDSLENNNDHIKNVFKTIDTSFIFDPDPNSDLDHRLKGSEITVIATTSSNPFFDGSNSGNNQNDSNEYEFKVNQLTIKGPEKPNNKFQVSPDSNNSLKFAKLYNSTDSITDIWMQNDSNSVQNRSNFFNFNSEGSSASIDKTYALFKEKLIKNNLPSVFDIITEPSKIIKGLRVTHKSSGFGFSGWTVDLLNYNSYLFKKMIPIFLFSIFLLGIIGLAFWTLLNNWIKQNRLVAVKNEFINNMTHELKTPIATVGVALEAISNFDLATEQKLTKEYIAISRNEINRLSFLVDKVLNIAAFDSKETALSAESINLNGIIQENIQSMRLQAEGKNAQIEYHNGVENPFIIGDKLHMSNVVHNILDNALKYSKEDPKIDISLTENIDKLILTFVDNGQGIPKAYQNKIFDRFFRVPSEDKHDVKGHGLGLNYVQNVVQRHGGKITVDSIENQGSTFTLTLPKSPSDV